MNESLQTIIIEFRRAILTYHWFLGDNDGMTHEQKSVWIFIKWDFEKVGLILIYTWRKFNEKKLQLVEKWNL